MNLAARISRLERQQASANGCGTCVRAGPVLREMYTVGNGALQEPDEPLPPATCPACGRRRDVTAIVIHLPEDGKHDP